MQTLLIEDSEQQAYRSLFDDRPARLLEFQQGQTFPLATALIRRTTVFHDAKVFEPQDISSWAVRVILDTEIVGVLETDSADPAAVVTLEQQGDATHNHKVSVTLPALRYGGDWTFTVAGVESGLIGWGDNAAEVQAAIGAIAGVGAANVSVEQTGDDTFLVEFIGTKALTAITGIDADGSTLKAIVTKSGTLDFRTAGIAALFGADEIQKVLPLSVLGTPAAGTEQVLLRRDVILNAFLGEYAAGEPIAIKGTIYSTTIDALTGTANALETVPTTTLAVGTRIQFVIDESEQSWVLYAGAAQAGNVAPLDYNASTNSKRWVKVGGL